VADQTVDQAVSDHAADWMAARPDDRTDDLADWTDDQAVSVQRNDHAADWMAARPDDWRDGLADWTVD